VAAQALRSAGRKLPLAAIVAAGLSLAAALVHLWAAPAHLAEWWGFGFAFVAMGWIQGLYVPLLLHRPNQRIAVLGIFINLAIIALYVISRTSGLPLGPHAGEAELAGALDMSATALEVGAIIVLTSLLRGPSRRVVLNAFVAVGLVLWAGRLAGILA
jgi:hypothetical protein